MAHTDRQPSQEIFDDIRRAAERTWKVLFYERDLDDSYFQEKMRHIEGITNYADNWYSYIGNMDSTNQRIFNSLLRRRDTKEFLVKQSIHYRYTVPIPEE